MSGQDRPLSAVAPPSISLSQMISALSYALDITEGQPMGHAVRSCLVGMRLADEVNYPAAQRHALFYALLLKDAGCSSNAAKMASLFKSDDQTLKHDVKTIDWTNKGQSLIYDHSQGVADIALGIGTLLGLSAPVLRDLKRAALLHDIGKLGVSSLILDKPGKLDEREYAQMRQHSSHTQEILGRVDALHHVSELACSHHERLDGKGYHRKLTAENLSTTARILPIADIYQALSADRPYRAGMPPDQALGIMRKEVGSGLCARAFAGLERYLDQAEKSTDAPLRKAS